MEKKKPTFGHGTISAQGYGFQVLDGTFLQAFESCKRYEWGLLLQRTKDRIAEIEASEPSDTDRRRLEHLKAKKRVLNYLIDRWERGLISKAAPGEDLSHKILRLTIEELEGQSQAPNFAGEKGICETVADRITNDDSYDVFSMSGVRDHLSNLIPDLQEQHSDLNLPNNQALTTWQQALPDLKKALQRL